MTDTKRTLSRAALKAKSPAFPTEAVGDRTVPLEHDYVQKGIHHSVFPGMTVRDLFAAHVASGVAAKHSTLHCTPEQAEGIAVTAYRVADALIARS